MNKLNIRLAKIAFNVLRAEEVAQKHWKTDEEVYSVSKWQRYLDKAKKRPKVHPTVVPDKKWGEAKKLKEKMQEEGATWEDWQDAIEKKFSPKKLKRENVYKTFGVDKKWNEIEKNEQIQREKKKQENKEKAKLNKQEKRKTHATEAKRLDDEGKFVYRGKEFKKLNCELSEDGEKLFDSTFVNPPEDEEKNPMGPVKKPMSAHDENILMNQLLQFRKDKPNVNRRRKSNEQLKQDFVRNMDPNAYANPAAFSEAKRRIMQMTGHEFMRLKDAVFAKLNEEDEEGIVEKHQKTNSKSKKAPTEKSIDEDVQNLKFV